MARAGITLLPGEATKLAAAYDRLYAEVIELRQRLAQYEKKTTSPSTESDDAD